MTAPGSRCLVVGAGGYIGRHLTQALRDDGHEVEEACRAPDPATGARAWDISDPGQIPADLESFDAVYLMAGRAGTAISYDQAADFIRSNVSGLAHLLNALRSQKSPPRVVFPSSRLVYRGQTNTALPEDAPKEALSPYASTKLMGEQLLQMYARRYGVPFTVVRICVPYGDRRPGPASYGTLGQFLAPARGGRPLSVFGDGGQKRSLIHIEDLARILATAGLHPGTRNGVFNLGGPDVLSLREIAGRVGAAFGVPVTSIPWPEDALKIESGDTIFDDSRLAAVLPLDYRHCFESWIHSMAQPHA